VPSGQIYSARSAPSVGIVSIRHHNPVVWCQICTIPTFGAAYGGNPRSERVKPLECDQTLCMIACHDALNTAPSALRLPSVQIPHCHIVGSRAHRISAASHSMSAAFRRPSHFRKLRTTGLQMSSYVSPDAWILRKAMSSV